MTVHKPEMHKNCALLDYYTASTTTRCVITQKSAVLSYFVAEAQNHAQRCINRGKMIELLCRLLICVMLPLLHEFSGLSVLQLTIPFM